MPLKNVSETIAQSIRESDELALAVMSSGLDSLIEGDAATCRLLFRNVILGTIGFGALATVTQIPQESLVDMLSENGNPSMNELSSIIQAIYAHLKAKDNGTGTS